jgi:hypothetical protein
LDLPEDYAPMIANFVGTEKTSGVSLVWVYTKIIIIKNK